jgi:sulfotransferase famil protein
MIDHLYKCIYIHQRKAAGSSLMAAFLQDHGQVEKQRYNGGVLGKDWIARAAPEDRYFVFSSVRNPFDRVISAWRYLPALASLPLEAVLQNLPAEGHDYRHITRSQSEMLVDARSHRLIVDDLIRFETLQPDFDRICDQIGKPRRQLERRNRTAREADYKRYYTPTTRAMVETIFKADLERFNYVF